MLVKLAAGVPAIPAALTHVFNSFACSAGVFNFFKKNNQKRVAPDNIQARQRRVPMALVILGVCSWLVELKCQQMNHETVRFTQ